MLPQSFWSAAWSAATRFIVSLDHGSHHQLVPGVSAIWVLSLVRCVGHCSISACSTCSGLGEWRQSPDVRGGCSQSHLRHGVRVVSRTYQSGGGPTAAAHLTDGPFDQKLPSGASGPLRQPTPGYQLFGYGDPLARLRYQNWQNLYQKRKKYFRTEIFLSSFVHVKIKSSYMRWPKQLLKPVYPWRDLPQHVFTVPAGGAVCWWN